MRKIQRDLKLVNQMWERSLTVSLIAENFECCSEHDQADSILRRMEENNWDEIGICTNQTSGSTATRYLRRQDLAELRGELSHIQGRTFEITDLVSANTPISQCLEHIVRRERLFVLDSSGVRKIVALADLSKQPVRIMLFAAVSLLEMAMLSRIQERFPEEEWKKLLSPGRVEKVRDLLAERKRKGHDIDLSDCLQISDKAKILLNCSQTYCEWDFKSKTLANKFFDRLNGLRDQLAHAQDPAGDSDWSEVSKMYLHAESLIRKMTAVSAD